MILGEQQYDLKQLDAVEEAFFTNFLFRRLVAFYRVPLGQISASMRQHVLHDLATVRYRAWLMLRHYGLTLDTMGQVIGEENAIDIFRQIWAKQPEGSTTAAPSATNDDWADRLAQVNRNRALYGLPPLGAKDKAPIPTDEAAKQYGGA